MKRKRISRILQLLLTASLVMGLAGILQTQQTERRCAAGYTAAAQLAGLLPQGTPTTGSADNDLSPQQPPDNIDLSALQAVNPDVTAWICIPGTVLSYPLMQGRDNDYYLNHTWQKEENPAGAIFLDYRCNADGQDFNTLVYGHRMRNDSMFGVLKQYRDPSFLSSAPSIYIIRTSGTYRYDIFSACEASVNEPLFTPGLQKETQKQEVLRFSQEHSFPDSRIVPTTEDHILTLVTCTGFGYDSRWIVQAALSAAL